MRSFIKKISENKIGWIAFLFSLCFFTLPSKTDAHKGPPYAIHIDEEIGPYMVSVWTDPDIGIGTFYVVFEPENEDHPIDDIESVEIAVQPVSGRLEEKVYDAEAEHTRNGARYTVEVEFDKGEFWNVRVIIKGEGWEKELRSEVEATPDGSIGPIGILIYALPFVGIGALWFRAIILRRRHSEEEEKED